MSSEAMALTDEMLELQRKEAEARKRYRSGRPAGDAEVSAPRTEAEPRTAACVKCAAPFVYVPILFQGREVAAKRWCDACVEESRQVALQLHRRQAGHLDALEASDKEKAIKGLLAMAGANAWEHGDSTLANFDVTEAGYRPVGLCREFAAAVAAQEPYEPVRGLYVHGGTGSGKTHLAVATCRLLIESDYNPSQILFDQAAELISRIQDTYGKKEASTFDVLEARFSAGLWVLDDLGTERPSDDVMRHLTLIFNRRAMRPTLITSNLSPEELEKQRPELMRVLSRLGPKYFRVCKVEGRDRRFD